jgi:hypothetical protein
MMFRPTKYSLLSDTSDNKIIGLLVKKYPGASTIFNIFLKLISIERYCYDDEMSETLLKLNSCLC